MREHSMLYQEEYKMLCRRWLCGRHMPGHWKRWSGWRCANFGPAAAARGLTPLPPVGIIVSVWMRVADVITGARSALDLDANIRLGIGRRLVVRVDLAGIDGALVASARWIVVLMESLAGARRSPAALEEVTGPGVDLQRMHRRLSPSNEPPRELTFAGLHSRDER